jgi:transcriptional regulator with XRE-family HTH domain
MNGIKLALMEASKPQYVVARETGIDETRLSRLATGRAKPTKDELKTLAAMLGVPLSKLEK